MGKRETMVALAVGVANDDSHGYSQYRRWPWQGTDFDCTSLVYWAAHEAGYDVPLSGYSGTMYEDFTNAGFTAVPWDGNIWDCTPGDILLAHNSNRQHAEIYVGDGDNVGAHIAETGDIDGEPGDQTGNEISIAPNWGDWDWVLIPPAEEKKEMTEWPLIVWPSNGGDNQKFVFERKSNDYHVIRCKANGKVVDVHGKQLKGDVNLYPENGGDNQLWKLVKLDEHGTYEIESALKKGYVLDVKGNKSEDGAGLCLWPRNGQGNQQWHLMWNADNSYTLVCNENRKLVLDAKDGGK